MAMGTIEATIEDSTIFRIYLFVWGSYFYFNGKNTDSEGDDVSAYEALKNVIMVERYMVICSTLRLVRDVEANYLFIGCRRRTECFQGNLLLFNRT